MGIGTMTKRNSSIHFAEVTLFICSFTVWEAAMGFPQCEKKKSTPSDRWCISLARFAVTYVIKSAKLNTVVRFYPFIDWQGGMDLEDTFELIWFSILNLGIHACILFCRKDLYPATQTRKDLNPRKMESTVLVCPCLSQASLYSRRG